MIRSLSILALLGLATLAPVRAQDWLPKDAEVCYRSQYQDGFLPDGTYCLKAKITKEQFEAIVKKAGATPHTASRKYTDNKAWLSWGAERGRDLKLIKGKARWDPEDDLATTFVRQEKDT
ncbi:hypothetical protein [Luteolibacter soli]|uniref:YARHG domain-containing protein n=1 Tax=Luteolibacter soli TaxID=3135280 RepID=A0ABU9AMR4_9BACT